MKTTTQDAGPTSPALLAAHQAAAQLVAGDRAAEALLARGLAVGGIVVGLDADEVCAVGAMVAPLVASGAIDHEAALRAFGEPATVFSRSLAELGSFRGADRHGAGRQLSADQAEALRKMLLAVVTDPRLVLVRLAEQLYDLREARSLSHAEREPLARETRDVYAPLASRLGIWQLKWELEDLSFRYLEPEQVPQHRQQAQ